MIKIKTIIFKASPRPWFAGVMIVKTTVENLDVNIIRKDITITNNYDRSTLKQTASFFLGTIVNNDCKMLKKALGMLDFSLDIPDAKIGDKYKVLLSKDGFKPQIKVKGSKAYTDVDKGNFKVSHEKDGEKSLILIKTMTYLLH